MIKSGLIFIVLVLFHENLACVSRETIVPHDAKAAMK